MITTSTRKVYFSTARGKSFLTLKAAAMAEASSVMSRKYPEETDEAYGVSHSVWHWSQDDRLVRVRNRMCRMIIRKQRKNERAAMKGGTQ